MAKRKLKRACRSSADLRRYLQHTIIPDTMQSGRWSTAADLKAGLRFLNGATSLTINGHRYTRSRFVAYLEDTLIPDLEESGSDGYAEDFTEIANALKEC